MKGTPTLKAAFAARLPEQSSQETKEQSLKKKSVVEKLAQVISGARILQCVKKIPALYFAGIINQKTCQRKLLLLS